ncbi:Cycloeucalenol cycloisomerase [Hondaea fermentalgiana]|uniref:Cycloeucalenol cycloisomerase n=1 Tax=Hondaea fermentalgiana TaxID=2315210 RepID=A0A2R5GSN4_9STRA|nr:Cycloeucalenol cycloisomerase [Hondaea fermentalgiana]|eukprot:GBG33886.1 Cycloeucalenol cycloisomerase [Hondaea fermentalgiana]
MTVRQRKGAASAAKADGNAASSSSSGSVDASKLGTKDAEWRLFSENPEKAWTEKFYLAYSPVWAALFGAWCFSGVHLLVGDLGNILATLVIAAPNILVPLLYCPTNKPWYQTYWFKFSVWVAIFTFEASYFFTEYFFDVLGMKYAFNHLSWNFDSIHVGKGVQVVPVMMYMHGWYFFITYHACSVVFIRMFRTAPVVRDSAIAQAFAVFASSLLFAWGEIKATTMEAIDDLFAYKDMDWALTWGALCYSCYFVPSFPMVYGLDESTDSSKHWSLRRTVESAFAAAMVAFTLLDLVTQFVVTDWQDRV